MCYLYIVIVAFVFLLEKFLLLLLQNHTRHPYSAISPQVYLRLGHLASTTVSKLLSFYVHKIISLINSVKLDFNPSTRPRH